MEKQRRLVDWIVAKATWGRFTGDERDDEAPPITIENFNLEASRYCARAYRTQLSRLSPAELSAQARADRAYLKKKPSELAQLAERFKREEAAQALSQRQAGFAKRPRLEAAIVAAIVAAARHYRNQGMTAAQAWDALYKTPFETEDGYTVKIEGPKLRRLDQRLRVISRDGRRQNRPIRFTRFYQKHWRAGT